MSGCCCETCKNIEWLQRAAVENGNGDVMDVLGYPATSFQVYGTFAGGTDVIIEFLTGLSTWLPLPVTNASDGVVTTTGIISAAGTYIANTAGLQKVRARVLNYAGADSINVVATAVCEASGVTVGGSSGGGGGGDVNLVEVGGAAIDLGQEAMAASIPVVIASNQSNLNVVVASALPAGTNNIGDVDVLSLPALPAGTNNIGDVDVLSVIPGTAATNLGKAEDAGHTSGDVGVMVLTVRNDTPGTLVNTNLDYAPQQVNANGLLRVEAGGVSAVVNGSFTRPNDTNTYAAGEVVSDSTSAPTAITFSNIARFPAGSGIITGALLVDSANQALKGSFELWLFDTAVVVDNDNTAFTPTDAELATLIGIIEFTTSFIGDATAGAGGNVVYPVVGRNVPFKCTGVLQDIYGVTVVRNAFIPVAQEVFTYRLRILQD